MKRFGFGRKLMISLLAICLCMAMTVPALALDPSTLYNGSRGEEVKALQQKLIDLGYLEGTADGIFGNKTEKAVRRFQWKNGMSADGLAGKKTLAALNGAQGGAKVPAAETAAAYPEPTRSSLPCRGSHQSSYFSLISLWISDETSVIQCMQERQHRCLRRI